MKAHWTLRAAWLIALVMMVATTVWQHYRGDQDAIEISKQLLALSEWMVGPEHPSLVTDLTDLALLYNVQGRYADAEPLYKRALAIREKALGPDHPDVAKSLDELAVNYRDQRRYGEAEPLYKRVLAMREKALGPDHPDVAGALGYLVANYRDQGRYADAEALCKRALAIREKALGPDHPDVAESLDKLAANYHDQGRYADAEPLYKRALAIRERALGPDHRNVAESLDHLSSIYVDQGRLDEASALLKRSFAITEKERGAPQTDFDLAIRSSRQGRHAAAEELSKRALAAEEKKLGPDHLHVAVSLELLASLYYWQSRHSEAEPLHKRVLAIREKALGPDHPDVAESLDKLAANYRNQKRHAEAEPLYKRVLAMREKSLSPDHPDVALSLHDLAANYRDQGRHSEAEPLYKRVLAIREKALGPEHPDVAQSLDDLAELAFVQRNWAQAADYSRRATEVIERRAGRGHTDSERSSTRENTERNSYYFSELVRRMDRLAPQGHTERTRLGKEMFEIAQWVQTSDAASSLMKMAARSAKGDTALAKLVRERQDLVDEWQGKDKQLIAAKVQEPAKRKPDAENVLSVRLVAIDARLAVIDAQLAKDFPEYASLTSPKPTSVAEVQALLQRNEALTLFIDTWQPKETFIWVITKGDIRWVKSELGTEGLTEHVAALRCGLDAALWDDETAAGRCRGLVRAVPERDTYGNVGYETLPFNMTQANALYQALFGPIADVIRDKHLLLVPSGALTQLPFQVLITDKPDPALYGTEALRRGAWLSRSHALTVLPSVSSLKALRHLAKISHASRTLIGFGNPLLDGPDARYAAWAAAARSKTSCPELTKKRVAELKGERRGVLPLNLRSGLADAGEIRSQVPLPETADELCAVARHFRVSDTDLWLGNRATETEVKRLSEAGELAKYRIVHFATHGALAGQVGGNSEPGLILTPPTTATEGDDGYLPASEITTLKLDADWVILSACNTAAGRAEGADALSGLARAFFYAGARALLVSHWAVKSNATVKLTTGAVERMAFDRRIGRAEAMRQSMLALIDKGAAYEAHPASWAPFVVVGEGAAAR